MRKKWVFFNYWNCFQEDYPLRYLKVLRGNKLYNYKKSDEVVVCHCLQHRVNNDQHWKKSYRPWSLKCFSHQNLKLLMDLNCQVCNIFFLIFYSKYRAGQKSTCCCFLLLITNSVFTYNQQTVDRIVSQESPWTTMFASDIVNCTDNCYDGRKKWDVLRLSHTFWGSPGP